LAAKDRGEFAVGIIGDGDLMYAPGAIWTAVNHSIPMLVVVNNNQAYLNDEQHQAEVARLRGRPVEKATIGTSLEEPGIDFAMLARSQGAWAEGPISEANALPDALRQAVRVVEQGGVAVVDVRTGK
jgi:acetolactate synthase-1/2/3 large subunit